MNKVIRDGKVAILYSPGFGAGWYSWSGNKDHPPMLYDPTLVKWVESGKPKTDWDRLCATLKEKYPDIYLGGLKDLDIRWVPVDTRFYIDEYDGYETVVLEHEVQWEVA